MKKIIKFASITLLALIAFLVTRSVSTPLQLEEKTFSNWAEDCISDQTDIRSMSESCFCQLMDFPYPTAIYRQGKLVAWNQDKVPSMNASGVKVIQSGLTSVVVAQKNSALANDGELWPVARGLLLANLLFFFVTIFYHLLLHHISQQITIIHNKSLTYLIGTCLFMVILYLLNLNEFFDISPLGHSNPSLIYLMLSFTSLGVYAFKNHIDNSETDADSVTNSRVRCVPAFVALGLLMLFFDSVVSHIVINAYVLEMKNLSLNNLLLIGQYTIGFFLASTFLTSLGLFIYSYIKEITPLFIDRIKWGYPIILAIIGLYHYFVAGNMNWTFYPTSLIIALLLDLSLDEKRVRFIWVIAWTIGMSFFLAISIQGSYNTLKKDTYNKHINIVEDISNEHSFRSIIVDGTEVISVDEVIHPLTESNQELNHAGYFEGINNDGHIFKIHYQNPYLLNILSIFSILFISFLLILTIIIGVNKIIRPLSTLSWISLNTTMLLRHKIQFSILGAVVLCFISIGIITAIIERSEHHREYKKSYSAVQESLQESLTLGAELKGISNNTPFSIHLYDKEYNNSNVHSAQIAHRLSPQMARHQLNRLLSFGSAENPKWAVIKENSTTLLSKASNSLLPKLINLYAFLFLFVLGVVYLLSDYITRPIEILSEKLVSIKLGEKNAKLEWENTDEIGQLISRYNLMLDEIDNSANMLAQNERDQAWKEMAKQVAHEINNPLSSMKLTMQFLRMKSQEKPGALSEQVERASDTLIEQIDNLSRIANSFRNFGQMPQASNQKVVLNDVVTSVHDLFRKREDIDIQCVVPIDEIFVFADRDHLVRILNNIVKNAIQAIPYNRKGRIMISLIQNEEQATITVQDNGIGIPESQQDKVFHPNFTTKSSGTGLGLAMCAKMIESMEGRIHFKTAESLGSTFFIEIPLMRLQQNFSHGLSI